MKQLTFTLTLVALLSFTGVSTANAFTASQTNPQIVPVNQQAVAPLTRTIMTRSLNWGLSYKAFSKKALSKKLLIKR